VSAEFFEDPDGTREQILAATYHTLCEHGYADLTISRIGEEFEKSPSLVYHHYESKDELVLECLEFMIDRFEHRTTDDVDQPRERLEEFFGWLLESNIEVERQQFIALLVELRTLASRDESYRRQFLRSDQVLERYLSNLLNSGIERGEFRECETEQVAAYVLTTLTGVMLRRSTHDIDPAWLEDVRAELEAYLEARVYRE